MTETQELDSLLNEISTIHSINKFDIPDQFLFKLYLLKKDYKATYTKIKECYTTNRNEVINFTNSVNAPDIINLLRYGYVVVKNKIKKIEQG